MVECTLTYNPMSREPEYSSTWDKLSFRSVNYHKADFEAIRADLGSIDWLSLFNLSEECGDCDGNLFKELIVLTTLQITLKHSSEKVRPIPTKSRIAKLLEPLKRRKRKLRSKIRKLREINPTSQTIPKLELELNLLTYDMKDVFINDMESKEAQAVETIKSNPKYFYSYAKRSSKNKSSIAPLQTPEGTLTNDAQEKAELLQTQYVGVFSDPQAADLDKSLSWVQPNVTDTLEDLHFSTKDIEDALSELDPYSAAPDHDIPAMILKACKTELAYPLWLMWDKSFQSGIIPPDLKLQEISPIYKKGSKAEPANYRPVSLTSHLIKTFERVLRSRLVEFLERNNILPDNQHGFRRNRSCLTQLLEHADTVLKHLNSGDEVDVIYLDYSKAFDKVDHRILLEKMKRYGIRGKVYNWIENFLTDRYQTVMVEGQKSSYQPVESGVPQGTVGGPVYFLIYVIDLALTLLHSKSLTFADDTKLLKAIMSLLCCSRLQEDLGKVFEWSVANNMQLHENKFEVINYCLNTSKVLHDLPFGAHLTALTHQYVTPGGVDIHPTDVVKDLGVYMSNDCSWSPHIKITAAQANKMASWVLSAFRDRSQLTMLTLFKSMVRSKLEYCCPLWDPPKIADIQSIEGVQRQFTRRIAGCKDLDYWDRLKKLKLMSLQRRRERYSIIQIWKIYNSQAPNSTDIQFYTSDRLGVRATVPSYNHQAQKSKSSSYDSSFGVKAPRLWNLLPKDVNTVSTLDAFKVAFGKFIERFPDQPPIQGYTAPNSNSLLSWSTAGVMGGCA